MKIESSSLTSRPSFGRVAVLLLAAAILAPAARAASQTWAASPDDAKWGNMSNWGTFLGATAPGTPTGATTNDVATFNSALSGGIGGSDTPIVIDTSRSIGGITFTGSSVGAYVIGSNAGNVLTLGNTGNAPGTHVIQLASSVANSQIIAAPIKFAAPSSTNGGFGFINNAASSSVTLSLTGAITSNSSSSRPGVLILDGTNTGTNVISGSITSPAFAQSVPLLVKRGVGTWILSGANNFSGGAMTSTTGTQGIQVLDGVLSVQNNQALGTSGTASSLQTWVGIKSTTYVYNGSTTATFTTTSSGGTLELGNSITLDNGVQLNLLNGGTVRSNGSTTSNAGINLSTAAAVTATLSTVGASDLFTVGNAANDLTGGAGDTVINIAGPGTVFLSQASNYAGTFLVNSGTLRIGSPTALGSASTAAVAFGASSTGTLQLNANNLTVVGLNTNATVGTPAVENGAAGTSVLTVNNASNGTYAGVLRDGAAGTLAFTKGGAGTQTLSGVNTYTGATIISTGTLALGTSGSINNSSSLSVGSGTVYNVSAVSGGYAVASGQTLKGTGSILGSTTIASGAFLAPGQGAPGVITFNNDLTLGGTVSVGINGTAIGSQYSNIVVGGNLGYGGTLSLNFGNPSADGSSYSLFSVTGTKSGDFSSVVLTGSHTTSLVGTSNVWTGVADGLTFTFNDSTGELDVVMAIPEPSTLALLSGLTALGCTAYVRRRRRQA